MIGYIDLSLSRINLSKVGPRQMRVGGMIDALLKFPKDNTLSFDFCRFAPVKWTSYRGYYEDLALVPGKVDRTVGDFLQEMQDALGKTMDGYKGGTYYVMRETPVWVAEWGDSGNTYVSGVEGTDWGHVIISTGYDNN